MGSYQQCNLSCFKPHDVTFCLPEVAIGKQLQQRSIEAMLDGSLAEFLQAEVKKINPTRQEITVKFLVNSNVLNLFIQKYASKVPHRLSHHLIKSVKL